MNSRTRPVGLMVLLAGVASCGGGTGGTTGPVPTHLAFGPLQDQITINTTFNPALTVQVLDASNQVVVRSRASILVFIRKVSPQPLTGTLTLRAVDGVATFADLNIDSLGTYQIVATSPGLDTTVSPAIMSVAPPPPPGQAEIRVGGAGAAIRFTSLANQTFNPAVDTIAVHGTALFTWAGGAHGVHSTGDPTFTGSDTSSVVGHEYTATFNAPGSYFYNCTVHGAAMSGKIVVIAPPPSAPHRQ